MLDMVFRSHGMMNWFHAKLNHRPKKLKTTAKAPLNIGKSLKINFGFIVFFGQPSRPGLCAGTKMPFFSTHNFLFPFP